MKRLFLAVVPVLLSFAINSCNTDDDASFQFVALEIVAADVPESFSLNGKYEITVTYVKPDNCTHIEGFDVVRRDTTIREVVAIGSNYISQECDQAATELKKSFIFEVLYDQPYLFRFWTGEDADGEPLFLDIEVPVE